MAGGAPLAAFCGFAVAEGAGACESSCVVPGATAPRTPAAAPAEAGDGMPVRGTAPARREVVVTPGSEVSIGPATGLAARRAHPVGMSRSSASVARDVLNCIGERLPGTVPGDAIGQIGQIRMQPRRLARVDERRRVTHAHGAVEVQDQGPLGHLENGTRTLER